MAKKETAAASLRSQFKATPLKKLQKVVDADDAAVGGGSNEYLNLVDGKTLKIRIFPAHPGQDAFYIKRKAYWLTVAGRDGDSRRTTVLDSKVHAGTEMDLVEEYVKFAKKKWSKDTAKINALVGTGMDSNSLNPQFTWLCYADVVTDDAELRAKVWEFKKMVRDALNRLSFAEDDGEPIEFDPFTDPDEGLPVLVKYMKNPNKKKGENYYEVNFAKKPIARPLSDEELEYFANLKPLSDVLPKYDMRMFDTALEGLQNFDEENEMGLFEDDEWLDIVEKVKAQYDGESGDNSDDDEDEEPKRKTAKKSAKKIEPEPEDDDDETSEEEEETEEEEPEEETADEGDELDGMDRTELKKYIKEKGLDVVVKKSWSDDQLRDEIRAAMKPEEESEEEPEEETEEEEDEPKPAAKMTLAEIKKKFANKNKK